jgi:hypothetical protein
MITYMASRGSAKQRASSVPAQCPLTQTPSLQSTYRSPIGLNLLVKSPDTALECLTFDIRVDIPLPFRKIHTGRLSTAFENHIDPNSRFGKKMATMLTYNKLSREKRKGKRLQHPSPLHRSHDILPPHLSVLRPNNPDQL